MSFKLTTAEELYFGLIEHRVPPARPHINPLVEVPQVVIKIKAFVLEGAKNLFSGCKVVPEVGDIAKLLFELALHIGSVHLN